MIHVKTAELSRAQVGEVIHILVEAFGEEMRDAAKADIEAGFADYPYRPVSLIASVDGKIVGFVQAITSYFNSNTYSILWLAVPVSLRRQGIGGALMRSAEKWVIDHKFGSSDGTFMIVAGHDPAYYKKQGYEGELLTHQGLPIMRKIHRASA